MKRPLPLPPIGPVTVQVAAKLADLKDAEGRKVFDIEVVRDAHGRIVGVTSDQDAKKGA